MHSLEMNIFKNWPRDWLKKYREPLPARQDMGSKMTPSWEKYI
jgi:hypothetical protein